MLEFLTMVQRTGSPTSGSKPPPIPAKKGKKAEPVPPQELAGGTSLPDISVEDDDARNESTQPAFRPVPAPMEELSQLLLQEIEGLEAGGGNEKAIGDAYLRLALIAKDISNDYDMVGVYCSSAANHPLAPRVLRASILGEALPSHSDDSESLGGLAFALGEITSAEFQNLAESLIEIARSLGKQYLATVRAELADAWLYRFQDPARAVALAEEALEVLGADSEVRSTYVIANTMLDNWPAIEAFYGESATASEITIAARIAFDHLQDPARAIEWLRECVGAMTFYGSSLEAQVLSVQGCDPGDMARLLIGRLELLASAAPKSAELIATAYALAEAQEQSGELEDAKVLLAKLTKKRGWSTSIAHLSALRIAARCGDWELAVEQLENLAALAKEAPLVGAYQRRCAEVYEHRLGNSEAAAKHWKAQFKTHPTDPEVCLNVMRLSLPDDAELIACLEYAAAENPKQVSFLRRATIVAENRLQDVERAVQLMRQCADRSKLTRDLYDLARLEGRLGNSQQVGEIYREIARTEKNPRISAALLLLSGMLEFVSGREKESLRALTEAHSQAPDDFATCAMLSILHRTANNKKELRKILVTLTTLTSHEDVRFDCQRELGEVCIDLGDTVAGKKSLLQALEIRPNDSRILIDVAQLHETSKEWDEAIKLRERAVKCAETPTEASTILFSIGEIEEQHRDDHDAASAAYQRALDSDPSNVQVLQTCQNSYRKAGKLKDLLELLREELKHVSDAERSLAIYLEVAELVPKVAEPAENLVAAYKGALEADPNSAVALKGILTAANKASDHQLVADAYSKADTTAKNVAILCEAYRGLKDWASYVKARESHIGLVSKQEDKSRYALEIAKICEEKLKDSDLAIAAYRSVLDYETGNRDAQAALRRLLEQSEEWRELASAIELELATIEDEKATIEERALLLARLAEVRRDELGRASEAALAYELILQIQPAHKETLGELESIYRQLGRDKELLRIRELQLGGEEDPVVEREISELRLKTGDIDGAIKSYQKAFEEDPSHRETFSALEKLCYSHERWPAVMDLYKEAIARVEKGETRAYRLGDLYSRRGQVQRQYLGDSKASAESYLRVIEVEPEDSRAMESLGEIYKELKDWPGLIAAHEKRAEHFEDEAKKLESLRSAAKLASEELSDKKEAARILRALTAIRPDDDFAIEFLQGFYSETKDWKELVTVLEAKYEKLEASGETDVTLLKKLAKLSEEGLRDETRAIRYYQRLVELSPQNRRALDALGRIYESTERWAEFVEVIRRLVKVTKDRNVKALLYFKCGSVTEAKFNNEKDAIRYYDAAIKTSPACLPAVHGLRDLYLRRKDWPRVIQTLELEVKLWQDDKERAGVFAQIGRIYGFELRQNDRAMHYYESALAVDPDCVPANRALFEHYFEAEQWHRALPLADALAPKAMRDGDPMRRSEFYRKRGIVTAKTGEPMPAAESIVIALEIKPDNVAAVVALKELSIEAPQAYDFPATFRELEKIYRRRNDSKQVLAHVIVAQAQFKTRTGALHDSIEALEEAIEIWPGDYEVVSALVELHASVRNWTAASAAIDSFLDDCSDTGMQVTALMRQARLLGDGQMQSEEAIKILQRVAEIDPNNFEIHYRLSQEQYCLERYDDARQSIEKVIELSAAPWANPSAERLARYYYYLGRILERGGEDQAAASKYRRATDYDPGYAPPALALALRSMKAGDQRQAETRLINSAHAAMAQGDKHSAIPLQRGLARILLKSGDREAAIEAYRGILEVEPRGAADRLSLAEIYAETDLKKAIGEVLRVIAGDLRHGPAYRVLSSYYTRANEKARSTRVLTTMNLLGYAEEQDPPLPKASPPPTFKRGLTTDLRMSLLANEHLASPVGELFSLCYEQMSNLFPLATLGDELTPLSSVSDKPLHKAVAELAKLFSIEPEVYVGDNVPGQVIALDHPRAILVLDRTVLKEPESARRFALGWAFEAICAGYSSLLLLGQKQRDEVGELIRGMFMPEIDRPAHTSEFVSSLPLAAVDILKNHEGEFQEMDMDAWMDGMHAVARRAGLLACDNLVASTRMLAKISGETIGADPSALGTVFCGEDLFQFYVSDRYNQLRDALNQPPTQAP